MATEFNLRHCKRILIGIIIFNVTLLMLSWNLYFNTGSTKHTDAKGYKSSFNTSIKVPNSLAADNAKNKVRQRAQYYNHRNKSEGSSIATDNEFIQTPQNASLILFWTFNYLYLSLGLDNARTDMIHYDCGKYHCNFTRNRDLLPQSHLVIFYCGRESVFDMPYTRKPWQRWALQCRESPATNPGSWLWNGHFNWTFTYHSDSDILWNWGFYVPHGQLDWGPYYVPPKYRSNQGQRNDKDYRNIVNSKHKQTLWMVSNCNVKDRNMYAQSLKRNGVKLDIYGKCGQSFPCKKSGIPNEHGDHNCTVEFVSQYKFFLSFENSHCQDYITEKTWRTLQMKMVPIVMGAAIEDYQYLLPPNSFIHVDNFTSPAKLAEYIDYLDNNDEAYSAYHAWRTDYEIITTRYENMHFWACDMCKKIQDPPKPAHKHLSDWWNKKTMCNSASIPYFITQKLLYVEYQTCFAILTLRASLGIFMACSFEMLPFYR